MEQTTTLEADPQRDAVRRAPWRQRLVDAESGLRVGMRADSTLFVFFFCAAILLLMALVLGLDRLEWAVLICVLGMGLAAELLHQVIKQVQLWCEREIPELESTLRLGTAGVMCAHLTAAAVSLLLFWNRFAQLWPEGPVDLQ